MNAVYGIYNGGTAMNYPTRNVKAIPLETEPTKYYKGSICHEHSKRNIGTTRTIIN